MRPDVTPYDPQHHQPAVLRFSWEEIEVLTQRLANALVAEGKPDVLVGLQRGGVIPAVMLSHQLATEMSVLPIRRTLSDALYASKQAPTAHIPAHFRHLRGKDVVIVDDIVGSGETLRTALQIIAAHAPSRIRSVACVVNRAHWDEANHTEPHASLSFIGSEVRAWVVFPWETMQGGRAQALSTAEQDAQERDGENNGSATERA